MAAKLIWSPRSVRALEEIVAYIAVDSPTYAADVARRVVAAVERLNAFPRMGRVVPELDQDDLRELIVHRYRIVYRVTPDAITVAAIVHGARDLLTALRDDQPPA